MNSAVFLLSIFTLSRLPLGTLYHITSTKSRKVGTFCIGLFWRVLVLVFHGSRERIFRQAIQIRKQHHNKLSAVMYQAFQPFIFFSEGIRSALDHSDFLRHLLHLLGFGRLRNRQPQVVFPYTDFPPHPHHAADK